MNAKKGKPMRTILLLALLVIVLFAVGCKKPQSSSTSSNPETDNTPQSQSNSIMAFEFYYRIPNGGSYELEITPTENGAHLSFRSEHDSFVVADKMVDASIVSDLLSLFEKYDVYSWDGFDTESEKEALETETFSMMINYGGGKMILADGNDVFPDTFFEFYEDLHAFTLEVALSQDGAVPLTDGVDYSLYTALIDSVTKEHSELATVSAYSYEGVDLQEVYGMVYSHLIDLDNNGVLELVMVTTDKGELSNDKRFDYDANHIEIYTITEQGELRKVGELPLLLLGSKHLSSGTVFAVNYSFVDGVGYIGTGNDTSDTYKQYYQYTPDGLHLDTTFEAILIADFGTSFSIDGESVEQEAFEERYYSFEQSTITHSISGMLQSEMWQLQKVNDTTKEFLKEYPIG